LPPVSAAASLARQRDTFVFAVFALD